MIENIIKLVKESNVQLWWPVDLNYHIKTGGDWKIEVILGAILTQNTKWSFVEKNIEYLKSKNFIFNIDNLKNLDINYIKVPFKSRKLETIKNIADSIENIDINNRVDYIRKELLDIHGIGKETADAIILYAFEKPILVIDYYTKRYFNLDIGYDKLRVKLETEIKDNMNRIEKLLKKKINNYKKYPFLSVYNLKDDIDYNKKLTIIYKEIHAMIDIKMKNLK
ncbi:endonuclease III [Nanobdella aerobiophila]|uniref:Endonuclease III n=1 Tax=Nanobdella aerobiophila TaxID=2586965 RepID=A0A915SCH2_9ARCH|nr:hypothetical protein [Nanobdella aerobiophila]BBL45388.1 endonuclease III [Nanobdella aerobiophila]